MSRRGRDDGESPLESAALRRIRLSAETPRALRPHKEMLSSASQNGAPALAVDGSRSPSSAPAAAHAGTPRLVLMAAGVVFGDIGTSPLYAIKECVDREHGVAATQANLFGLLSLVFWSLTMVVTVKYLTFIMKADNGGEGGILALLALVPAKKGRSSTQISWTAELVIFGAALLYGDGVITPAISVLSAVEGLE